MSGEFAQRVRSAAIAGWWTVLMATLFLAGQWVAYLLVIGSKPAWMLSHEMARLGEIVLRWTVVDLATRHSTKG
jgi:hypothetical protein